MGFKALYWDLKDGAVRQDWQYEIVRNMPGRFGFLLRRKALQNRFKKAGQTMRIHKGCRIINIDKLEIGDSVHFGVDSYIQAGGGASLSDHLRKWALVLKSGHKPIFMMILKHPWKILDTNIVR